MGRKCRTRGREFRTKLVENFEGNRSLGRHGHSGQDNIKLDLEEKE
jgi:hypothetical protein